MKKTLLALSIAVVGCATLSASAQAPRTCCSEPTSNSARIDNKMYKPQKFTDFAFEGVLLDINQQQRMDSLNAAVKAQCPNAQACSATPCNTQNCQTSNCTEAQNCANGQACNTNGKGKHGGRDKAGHKRNVRPPYGPEYIKKVKEILTPDQYTTFLENIVMMPYNQAASCKGDPRRR